MVCWWGWFLRLWITARIIFYGAHCVDVPARGGSGDDKTDSAMDAVVGGIDVAVWTGAYEGHLHTEVYGSVAVA